MIKGLKDQRLEVERELETRTAPVAAALARTFPSMTAVHSITADNISTGIGDTLINAFILLPNLTSLTLLDTPSICCSNELASRFPGPLRSFTFAQRVTQPPEYDQDMLKKMKALNLFLMTHAFGAKTLRTLSIPAELTMPGLLANVPWPELDTLIFTGYPPITQDSDFIRLCAAAPRLRTLRIDLARSATTKGFKVWHPQHGKITSNPAPLRHLEHLTLHSPENNDLIFHHLPAGLRELDLRFIREPSVYAVTEDVQTYTQGSANPTSIFQNAVLPHLHTLRITINASMFPEAIFAAITDCCPKLEFLELQCPSFSENLQEALLSTFISINSSRDQLPHLQELCMHFMNPALSSAWADGAISDHDRNLWREHATTFGMRAPALRVAVMLAGMRFIEVERVAFSAADRKIGMQ